jgi:hypothetical protein
MFCSGCGQVIAAGQTYCPQCGRPVAAAVPPIPGIQFEVESYAGKVKSLSTVWFIYAAFSFLAGVAGLTFAQAFFSNHFGNWGHGPWSNGPGPEWFGPVFMHFAWSALIVRSGLALVAAWGLLERTHWGRVVAIVAAVLSLLKFPFGTAIGIWTLVLLLGYRNTTLYEQI